MMILLGNCFCKFSYYARMQAHAMAGKSNSFEHALLYVSVIHEYSQAGRVFALSMFSALGNISAIAPSFVFLVRSGVPTSILTGWLTIFFHVVLFVIFTVCAAYTGYALRCSICCTEKEEAQVCWSSRYLVKLSSKTDSFNKGKCVPIRPVIYFTNIGHCNDIQIRSMCPLYI